MHVSSSKTTKKITWKGREYNPHHVIVIVHSSVYSCERRNLIRKTWARDQKWLPIKVLFLIGISNHPANTSQESSCANESQNNSDLLQENFIDTYNNLTLKSMFMLKYLVKSAEDLGMKYAMKVDDDSYINLPRLLDYITIIEKRCQHKCIVGHVLGPSSPVLRPRDPTLDFTQKWEVPTYIYPDNVYPNAVSGSGYIISQDVVSCLYQNGLQTPFLNVEDVFITGLAATKCHVTLKNSQWFSFMGKAAKMVKKQDILVHNVKTEEQMMEIHTRVSLMYGKSP